MKTMRNFGICAHIDAGKTTITERILFYTGYKHKIGEVHDGEATMDWMDQEQERGITINSASTTVTWYYKNKNYKLNIIDTPGHVDFTAEVERTMRILDGVCLVLCAVGGIQPQTKTVWNQINKYKVARICFINKMDRTGANFNKVCASIRKKLKCKIILLYYPIFKKTQFKGIYDILKLKEIYFKGTKGEKLVIKNINPKNLNFIKKLQEQQIEELIKDDEKLIEAFLEKKLTLNTIQALIREQTIHCKLMPILCGSAFKNKGIQKLIDSIIKYLPAPMEKQIKYFTLKNIQKPLKINNTHFAALIFKIINDPYSGRISFARIYSGKIKPGEKIYNCNQKTTEKIGRIIIYKVNKKEEVKQAHPGEIVAFIGLKTTHTGDTLCKEEKKIILEKIQFPEPVISFSVCTANENDHDKLVNAITKTAIEDPTIKITTNTQTNDLIISGMGELHIEVFIERIRRENKLAVIIKDPKVAYKETITQPFLKSIGKYIRQSGGRGQYGHVEINLFPRKIGKGIKFVNKIKSGAIPKEYIKPIKKSILKCCKRGYLTNSPIVDITIELYDGSFHEVDSNENAFEIAAAIAFKNAFLNAKPILLEPIMLVNITIKEKYLGIIISDIASRRGEIISTKQHITNYTIKANIPLANMFNYTTKMRSKTKGEIEYTMTLSHYKKLKTNETKTNTKIL
ncbi:elongation factor G [Candidatus Vidania fulgoroideae]|uniref:Elongation factor G n=1 Tax=Candidatus Vidania fulgoroideorum TaxID=881286 RepID=A0A974X7M7_9PROT|nr:elongation factor G [Candidatus Vidania fulgoroideae]